MTPEGHWSLFYRNPRLTLVVVAAILILGLVALETLPRQEDPSMTRRYAQVETEFPGASAKRVEALVAETLETHLREVAEIERLRSVSRTGRSYIVVSLAQRVGPQQAELAWSEIRDKLAAASAELPTAAGPPTLQIREPTAYTLLAAFRWRGEGPPQTTLLGRLAQELEIQLANLPDTRRTRIYGAPREEIQVIPDPLQLPAAGLSVTSLADRIRSADTRQPAGRLQGGDSELLLEVTDEPDSAERIARIPVQTGDRGELLRVGDIARVLKTTRDPPPELALLDGEPAVVVATMMESGQRVDRWSARARDRVERFAAGLPPQVGVDVIFDQNTYTGARFATLTGNLVLALILIMLLLVVFMGLRSALIVGVTLPLTLALVVSALMVLGIPLHQMSITGLIISLGLLIDNAIVVVEQYRLRRQQGAAIGLAIANSIRRLVVPLAASTATTVLAFLPIALTGGDIGEFTGSIAISVVLSVAGSFLLAMTVVPALAGLLEARFPLRHHPDPDSAPWWQHGFRHAGLRRQYEHSLDAVLRRPWIGVLVGLALPLTGFLLAPGMAVQFFPPVDRNQFQLQLHLPADSSIHQTRASVERLRALLDDYDEITSDSFFLGVSPPMVYYNMLQAEDGVASFAGGLITTRTPEAAREILLDLQQRVLTEFPEAQVLALPFGQGPPFSAPLEIRIMGEDFATLRALGQQLRSVLAQTPGVTYTHAELDTPEPRLALHPNPHETARVGLSLDALPRQLAAAVSGQHAGAVLEGTHELPVQVRLGAPDRATLSDLQRHYLFAMTAAEPGFAGIPLQQLLAPRLEPAAYAVERINGERLNTVRGYLMPFELPATALDRFHERLDAASLDLPAGYRLLYGGEAEEREDGVGRLLQTFVVFLAFIVGVVVLALNSFRHTLIIGLVGLLAVGLALFGMQLFRMPLGFIGLIGTLGLIGLSINGAIIVLTALKGDADAAAGDLLRARQVVVDASRHILSTTVTTIAGFTPLILFGGTFWPPLATAIAGGVAGSAILALYLVPALFVSWNGRRRAGLEEGNPAHGGV